MNDPSVPWSSRDVSSPSSSVVAAMLATSTSVSGAVVFAIRGLQKQLNPPPHCANQRPCQASRPSKEAKGKGGTAVHSAAGCMPPRVAREGAREPQRKSEQWAGLPQLAFDLVNAVLQQREGTHQRLMLRSDNPLKAQQALMCGRGLRLIPPVRSRDESCRKGNRDGDRC